MGEVGLGVEGGRQRLPQGVQRGDVATPPPPLTDAAGMRAEVEAILYRWAGQDGVDPASRLNDVDVRQWGMCYSLGTAAPRGLPETSSPG